MVPMTDRNNNLNLDPGDSFQVLRKWTYLDRISL